MFQHTSPEQAIDRIEVLVAESAVEIRELMETSDHETIADVLTNLADSVTATAHRAISDIPQRGEHAQ